jgi:hypothetical protein
MTQFQRNLALLALAAAAFAFGLTHGRGHLGPATHGCTLPFELPCTLER